MSSKDYIKDPKLNNLGVFENTNNIYIIPSYQRSYAWSKDRVISFWDELIISDNKSGYNISFTGSVILKHNKETDESDHFEVIDGQQRFITTSILIAVLRDYSKFLIKNKLYPVVGVVSMDSCMINITNTKIKEGEEVFYFNKKRNICELAKDLNTIPYEITSSLSKRIKRIYI